MRPIFDNRAFIEWIGKQPQDKRYVYDSCLDCLIARYLKERGVQGFMVQKDAVLFRNVEDGTSRLLPEHWNAVAEGKGKTYGAAHARALELLG